MKAWLQDLDDLARLGRKDQGRNCMERQWSCLLEQDNIILIIFEINDQNDVPILMLLKTRD